ncbi:MAG TPA: sialate O-acetylesterase [Paludibaculum sp.]|jgi:sialate O-acetylesterase
MTSILSVSIRAIALISMALCALRAEVTLPSLFTDHMVIQRDMPVHVWGRGEPGERVTVRFGAAERAAVASERGAWSVYLPPVAAGGPFELVVRAANTVTLRDVLVGDVWVGSGQSNMEMAVASVKDAAAEIAGADQPRIRLFTVKRRASQYPRSETEAEGWAVSTPTTTEGFSAVLYFFARQIQASQNVPIGLIHSSWGGTPLEAWMSMRSLTSDASLMPALALWSQTMDEFEDWQWRWGGRLKQWEREVEEAKKAGKPAPGRPWSNNQENSWMPGGLYNGMIAPLTPFPIRGVLWYQGESNASRERAPLYAHMFETMIRDWRAAWGVGEFPFLFVQLANFKAGESSRWPELREAQLQTLSVAKTGMAVAIDIGDAQDIHPKNKQEVGRRLALAARALGYGEQIEYSGPLYRTSAVEGGSLRVWFDHAARLEAAGGAVRGFEIAGADGKFVAAEARIDGGTVVVSAASVDAPRQVRYGWLDNPECTLRNGEGLPASPFRSGR